MINPIPLARKVTFLLAFLFIYSSSNAQLGGLLSNFKKRNITSIEVHLDTANGVNFGSQIYVGFSAVDDKGNYYHTDYAPSNGKKVDFDRFNVSTFGGKFYGGRLTVNDVIDSGFVNLGVKLVVSNVSDKFKSRTKAILIPLSFNQDYALNYSGAPGNNGAPGAYGQTGTSGTSGADGRDGANGGYGAGKDGKGGTGSPGGKGGNAQNDAGEGGPGGNGSDGANGENGGDITVFLSAFEEKAGLTSLRFAVYNKQDSSITYGISNADLNSISILADGGKGGDGGNGGQGGRGGTGGKGGDGGKGGKGGSGKPGKRGGKGGKGGDSGNGGRGGKGGVGGVGGKGARGGKGGKITYVLLNEKAVELKDKIYLSNKGGAAGNAGPAGLAGLAGPGGAKGVAFTLGIFGNGGGGGQGGKKKEGRAPRGDKGPNGKNGAPGEAGKPGKVGKEGKAGKAGTDGPEIEVISNPDEAKKAYKKIKSEELDIILMKKFSKTISAKQKDISVSANSDIIAANIDELLNGGDNPKLSDPSKSRLVIYLPYINGKAIQPLQVNGRIVCNIEENQYLIMETDPGRVNINFGSKPLGFIAHEGINYFIKGVKPQSFTRKVGSVFTKGADLVTGDKATAVEAIEVAESEAKSDLNGMDPGGCAN